MIIKKAGLYRLVKAYGPMPKGIYLILKKSIAGMFEIEAGNNLHRPSQYYTLPVKLIKEL